MTNKLNYEDIKLCGKVQLWNGKNEAEIVSIENFASLAGINEPVFTVRDNEGMYYHFGLKYILKYYLGL